MNLPRIIPAAVLMLTIGQAALAGGTLVVCDDSREPATLDPQRQFTEKNHTLLQQIYEPLVRFTPDGEIEPALAESWESVGPMRMRFHLRQGVRFHNGEPFDAEAVRFTFERYTDPAIDFPAMSFIESVERVEVVDSHTVDIITRHPDGLLLNRLAGFVLIVPPEYVRENGHDVLHRRPVGTGAFRFDEREANTRITLEANPDYWMKGLPHLDKLVFRFAPTEQQVEMLLDAEVDLVTELPGTLTTRVESTEDAYVVKQRTFWTVGATMRSDEGPLADVRVRRALNLAIDRDALIRFDVRGNGSIIGSLTMKDQEGHNPDLEPYPYDPEKAERLLDEAGVERPLVLRTMARAQAERTARIIAAHLARIGVHMEIQAVYTDDELIQGLASEEWDMAIGALPDPMAHSYFGQSVLLFSQSPFSLNDNEEFDRRLIEMVQTLDPEKREQLGRELDAFVHDQALSLFTYQKVKTYGLRSDVRFAPYVTGMPYYFGVRRKDDDTSDDETGDDALASP